MKLSDLLSESFILPDVAAGSKEDVIAGIIALFKNDPRVTDIEKVTQAVLDRERIMSTGVGKNFAIPHGKTDAVTDIICAFARSSAPIEYEALDQQPVHLIFLIVGKDTLVSMHIKLLSRISRMMTKDAFRDKLMKAGSATEILQVFRDEESAYFEL